MPLTTVVIVVRRFVTPVVTSADVYVVTDFVVDPPAPAATVVLDFEPEELVVDAADEADVRDAEEALA